MKYVETRDIPLADIEVSGRLREVDPEAVEAIRTSWRDVGQLTPIAVEPSTNGKPFRLIAGAHRMAVAEALGLATIRAEIKTGGTSKKARLQAELQEVDENLGRNEPKGLDRAIFVGRRLELIEALHPERFLNQGGDRRSAEFFKTRDSVLKFAEETGALLNKSDDVVTRALAIWRGLAPETIARLKGTHLAKNEGELYRLTRFSPEQQAEIVARCLTPVVADEKEVWPSVAQAGAALSGAAIAPKPAHVVETAKLRDAWDRAGTRAKTAHLQFLVDIGVIESFTVEHL